MKFLLMCTSLLVLSPFGLWSEELDWVDIDAPQLSEAELEWLELVLDAEGNALGLEYALDFLEEGVQSGGLSAADPALLGLLRRIVLLPYASSGVQAHERFRERLRAVALLGLLGRRVPGDAAGAGRARVLELLDELLQVEENASVLREVYAAYEVLRPRFTRLRSEYFAVHLQRALYLERNPALADAILQAVSAMYEAHERMDSVALYAAILAVQHDGAGQALREFARGLARRVAGLDF